MGTVVLSRPLGRPIHTGGKEFVIPAGEENLRRDGIADELFFLFSFFFSLADPFGRVCRRFVDMSTYSCSLSRGRVARRGDRLLD